MTVGETILRTRGHLADHFGLDVKEVTHESQSTVGNPQHNFFLRTETRPGTQKIDSFLNKLSTKYQVFEDGPYVSVGIKLGDRRKVVVRIHREGSHFRTTELDLFLKMLLEAKIRDVANKVVKKPKTDEKN